MPRGIKRITEEKISESEESIKRLQAKISKKQKELEELRRQKKVEDMEIVISTAEENGLSPEDIVKLITKNCQTTA